MFSRIRSGVTFSNVTALMALFVALGGTAYAAVKLPRNSVGATQIKKNGVRASEVRAGAVGTSEVKNGSLRLRDFRASEVPVGQQGPQGERGPAGEKGTDGTDGAPGAPGTAQAFARVQANATLQPNVAGFPPQNKGAFLISEGEGGAAVGTYCFDTEFRPASAVVTLDNADAAAADRNLIASVAIGRGEDLGDCPANRNDVRVRIVDGNTEAAQDARFFLWLEG
jgi:hypothetical protein